MASQMFANFCHVTYRKDTFSESEPEWLEEGGVGGRHGLLRSAASVDVVVVVVAAEGGGGGRAPTAAAVVVTTASLLSLT